MHTTFFFTKAQHALSLKPRVVSSRHFLCFKMSNKISDRISLFRSQIEHRRFDEGTLRILELILVSKDVNSLLEIRCVLRNFMRSEALCIFQEILEKTVEHKLFILDFFVRAFALAGDVESCLALKYEALVLRERKSSVNDNLLQVSYEEWVTFAEDSINNGFYTNAVKGFENALLSIQSEKCLGNPRPGSFPGAQVIENIKKLKDTAVALVSSHSVQAQTAEHLKKKTVQKNSTARAYSIDTQCLASSMFRNGIKKRNMQKLRELQSLQKNNTET